MSQQTQEAPAEQRQQSKSNSPTVEIPPEPEQSTEKQTDYYEILGIQKTATTDEIKKAYRKMALKYHPDKAGTSATMLDMFGQIQKAYDVLTDPKLRPVYDKYGQKGLDMVSQMGNFAPFIDPEMLLKLNRILVVATIFVALLIAFPAMLAARIENTVSYSYVIAFIPLFIVDFIVLSTIIGTPVSRFDDNGEKRPKNEYYRNILLRLGILTYFLLFVLVQVFICTKLDGTLTTSWALLSIPWFILEIINFVVNTIGMLSMLKETKYDGTGEEARPLKFRERIRVIFDCLYPQVIRVAFVILVVYKISTVNTISWTIIFIPFWVLAFIQVTTIVIDVREAFHVRFSTDDSRASISKAVIFVIFGGLFYTFVGLLVSRLNNPTNTPSVAIILIPVFIVLGMLFCCTCCCIPCMANGGGNEVIEKEMVSPDNVVVMINNNRITVE